MNEMEIRRPDELEQLTPEQLGGEIRLLTSQARKIVLAYAVEIGHRLVLAKEKVAHGDWIDWVARETTLSQSSANRMMRLYEEYGSRQESLFGAEVNSSTLTNLSVSNALQLLAYPPEEREQAAAELDAEHLSSRELAEAIEQAVTVAKAKADAEAAEKINALQKKLEKAEKDRDKLKDAAGKAESGAAEKVAAAERDAAAARQELEEARKKLKASNANVAVFGAYFKAMQEDFNKALEMLPEIGENDRETAEKLRGGMKVLIGKMLERIGV